MTSSGSPLPYCATYEYPGSSVGYGCAAASGFTAAVALSITGSDGGSLSIPLPTSSLSLSSSTTIVLPTPTPVPPQDKNNGLSGGAIAGIVIGSIAGLLAIGALVFWIITMRRKHREQRREDYRLSGSTQRSSTPGVGGWFKPVETERSPTLNQVSPGPEFGHAARETYPIGYSGTPQIAEMGTPEPKYERA